MPRLVLALSVLLAGLTPALANGSLPGKEAYRSAMHHHPGLVMAANTKVGKPVEAPKTESTGKLSTTQVQRDPLSLLRQFNASDLQAALDDANAQNPPDKTSAQCYSALLTIVNSPLSNPLPSQLGLFLALQKARDAQAFLSNLQSPNGPLASLNIACAPLIMNVNATLLQLGVVTGLVVGTGGIAIPALPALPGLLSILPK